VNVVTFKGLTLLFYTSIPVSPMHGNIVANHVLEVLSVPSSHYSIFWWFKR